jgi:hypothetical protein
MSGKSDNGPTSGNRGRAWTWDAYWEIEGVGSIFVADFFTRRWERRDFFFKRIPIFLGA